MGSIGANQTAPRVLVVDDDEMVLRALARTLGAGHHVVTASTPEQALALLQAQPFELVISDLNMRREGDGRWVLEQARAHRPEARRILMSGDRGVPDDGALFERFLAKPFTNETLLACVAPPSST